MAHAISTIEFLVRNGRMPDLIVVGLENTDRTRDLTPTRAAMLGADGKPVPTPASGGSDDLIRFIETELLPYIDKNFRTQPYRILAGHSLGGLFAMHVLTSRPELFQAYIAASPTVAWDNFFMTKRFRKFLQERKELAKTLYIAVGNEGGETQQGFDELIAALKGKKLKGLEWDSSSMPDENHGSMVLRAYYQGLMTVYGKWNPPEDRATGQILGGVNGADAHYKKLTERFGYPIPTPEAVINRVGYGFLVNREWDQAIDVFKKNIERHPQSANAYDSLADAYTGARKFMLALEAAKKAVELGTANSDPQLPIYRQRLERISAGFAAAAK
jgi:predicted alpha/beta superfamily hydrolase